MTDERFFTLARLHGFEPDRALREFAEAIEAEVRPAPDLLIALRDLLDDLQMDMLTAPAGSFRMIKSGRRIEQAHAAIAKATGEV